MSRPLYRSMLVIRYLVTEPKTLSLDILSCVLSLEVNDKIFLDFLNLLRQTYRSMESTKPGKRCSELSASRRKVAANGSEDQEICIGWGSYFSYQITVQQPTWSSQEWNEFYG